MTVQFAGSPPESYLAYIRDMLGQLADMAHENGEGRLEQSIRHAVQDADASAAATPESRRSAAD